MRCAPPSRTTWMPAVAKSTPRRAGQCFDRDLVARGLQQRQPCSSRRQRSSESAFDFLVVVGGSFPQRSLGRRQRLSSADAEERSKRDEEALRVLRCRRTRLRSRPCWSEPLPVMRGFRVARERLRFSAAMRTRTGSAGLFVIRADGSGLRRLTPSGSDIGLFEWAPDGSRIAYLDRRGALWLVRPDGTGRVLLAASSPLRSPWVLSWSPDGKAIAVLARDPDEGPRPPNAFQTSGSMSSRPTGARRGVSRPAMSLSSTGLRKETRSPTGTGPGGNGSSAPTGASHGPFSAVRRPVGKGCLHGRRTERTSGSSGSGARFGTDATPTAMPGSMSLTRTEATSPRHEPCLQRVRVRLVAGRAVDSLRQGEPRGHLRDRRRRTEQPPADARFAHSLRVSGSGVGAGRAIGRLRNRPHRQRRHLPDRRRRPQQGSTHELSRERHRPLLAT